MIKLKQNLLGHQFPTDDTTIPQPWNILRRIPRHLSSSFILRVKKMILSQKVTKARSNATSPPHPTPDPNVLSGELLLPEAAGKLRNSLRGKKKKSSHCSWIHSNLFMGPKGNLGSAQVGRRWRDLGAGKMPDLCLLLSKAGDFWSSLKR